MGEQLYRIDPRYDTIENATGRLVSDCVMTGVLVPVEIDYMAAEYVLRDSDSDRALVREIIDTALHWMGCDDAEG